MDNSIPYLTVVVGLKVDLTPTLHPLHGETSGEAVVEGKLLPTILIQCTLDEPPTIAVTDVICLGRGGLGYRHSVGICVCSDTSFFLLCYRDALAPHYRRRLGHSSSRRHLGRFKKNQLCQCQIYR